MIIVCNKWVRAGASTAIIVAAFASLLFSLILIFFIFPRTEQIGTRLQTQIGLVEKEIDSKNQTAQVAGNVSRSTPPGKIIFSDSPAFSSQSAQTTGNPVSLLPILISEVLVYGTEATDEFVELFNPNTTSVDMTGWQLKKKTESGTEYTLVTNKKFSGIILGQGYFLISHPNVQDKYKADLAWSSTGYSIAEGNIVVLFDASGNIVSSVDTTGILNGRSASLKSLSNSEFIVSEPSPHNNLFKPGFEISVPAASPVSLVPTSSPLPSAEVFPSPSPLPVIVSYSDFSPTPSVIPSPSPETGLVPTPLPSPSPEPTPLAHPSITQIQSGLEASANADFIQMYNSGNNPLDLTDYKLVKKTAGSGNEYSIKSWKNDQASVPGQTYFYWVNSGYTDKINELTTQEVLFFTTTATITETNGIALKYQDVVVDSKQW